MLEIQLPALTERTINFAPVESTRGPDEVATSSPTGLDGRIRLGGPIGVLLDSTYVKEDDDLRVFVDQEAGRFVYHLVHLSLTCESPPTAPRLETAAVRLALTSAGSLGAPIAYSMTPLRITDPAELTTTVKLGPRLKLLGVEVSLGDFEYKKQQSREEVYLEGLNEMRSDPKWELRRTHSEELRGSHLLAMVVRTELGWTPTVSGTVHGAIRRGSILRRGWSDLPQPLTMSVQL